MKKKAIMLLLLVVVGSSAAVTVITTPAELQAMGNDLAGNYILGNDIDMTGFPWKAISYRAEGVNKSFTGPFDGDFHVINGFTGIDDDWQTGPYKTASLFGILGEGGVVKNVGMTNVNCTAGDYVAALVGDLFNGTVSKCYVESGTVTMVGGNNGGTLIGMMRGTSIVKDCYSTANLVQNGGNSAGGFINGAWSVGNVSNCYFAGTVTFVNGNTQIGGFINANGGGDGNQFLLL